MAKRWRYTLQGMSLEQAIKRFNSPKNYECKKPDEVAAWLEFRRLVQQTRETALEAGVIQIKSPGVAGTTSGRQFTINKQK